MKAICPHCNLEYPNIDEVLLDQEVKCSGCGEIFVVEKIKFDRQIDIKPQKNNIIDKTKLINCPACGSLVSKKAPTCPKCGERITLGKCRSKKIGWLLFICSLFCCFLAYYGSGVHDKTGDNTILAIGIVGLILTLLGMAVCFTSPSGR